MRLGYKSPRSFGMVVKGERLPSEEMIHSLSQYLKLNRRKRDYLLALLKLERKKKKGKLTKEDIKSLKKINPRFSSFKTLNLDEFKPISSWYYIPLRQFFIHPFHEERISEIPKIFNNSLTLSQVKEAINHMLKLGFLSKDELGFIKIEKQGFNTPSDIPSSAIAQHHMEMLDQAKLHVLKDVVEDREFQSLTFRCKKSEMPAAKEFIREFKEEFNKRFANDEGEEVHQLSLQFFRHTKIQDHHEH